MFILFSLLGITAFHFAFAGLGMLIESYDNKRAELVRRCTSDEGRI